MASFKPFCIWIVDSPLYEIGLLLILNLEGLAQERIWNRGGGVALSSPASEHYCTLRLGLSTDHGGIRSANKTDSFGITQNSRKIEDPSLK